MRRRTVVWFVRCARDDPALDASWQPALHPHIRHHCTRCFAAVHEEPYGSPKHELRQASVTRRPHEPLQNMMDRLYAHPTQYLHPRKETEQ